MPTLSPPSRQHRAPSALRVRRAQLGLTQEGVSGQSMSNEGEVLISQRTVSDLEQGNVALLDLSARRLVALAQALQWSLPELQKAAGVDLGFKDVWDDGDGHWDDGSTWDDGGVWEGNPKQDYQPQNRSPRRTDRATLVASPLLSAAYVQATAEGTTVGIAEEGTPLTLPNGTTIRHNDILFVDTKQTTPELGKVYFVEFEGQGTIRLLRKFAGMLVWVYDAPEHEPEPLEKAKVIGRVVRFMNHHEA
jgi:transcriptional regulator with XRE-family HTH domain